MGSDGEDGLMCNDRDQRIFSTGCAGKRARNAESTSKRSLTQDD